MPTRPTRVTGATCTALALTLALSSCGLIQDLTGDQEDPQGNSEETAQETPTHPELPYVRQGRMFFEDGDDVTFELTVTNLEHNGEYLMLEVTHNYLEPLRGTVTAQNAPVRLVDPLSGEVMRAMTDEEHDDLYGTHFVLGDPFMPTHEGLPTTLRRYFPIPSEEVQRLTLTGGGAAHMPGIPITHVDEFTEAPEPNAHEYIDPDTFAQEPELPDEIWYPDNPPQPGLETDPYLQSLESYVDSPTSATTRAGEEETIALHSDNMFDVDKSDPTDEATETIRQAAQSMRENLGEDVDEITIIGHTDSQGSNDYNQNLSEERALSVQQLLEEELDGAFTLTTEGRGSTELLAQEDGSDDEQARARNRRVEFSYQVPLIEGEQTQDGTGLDSAKRHVAPPAPYFEDLEPFTTTSHNDVDLNVYPMVRDGAYLFQMVGFQNSTLSDLEADLETDQGSVPGSPAQYTEGTMGGFRLEDDQGLVRYVIRISTGQDEYEDFADQIHTLSPGEEYLALAVFPAPHTDTEEMTLHAGSFGEIADVPIH